MESKAGQLGSRKRQSPKSAFCQPPSRIAAGHVDDAARLGNLNPAPHRSTGIPRVNLLPLSTFFLASPSRMVKRSRAPSVSNQIRKAPCTCAPFRLPLSLDRLPRAWHRAIDASTDQHKGKGILPLAAKSTRVGDLFPRSTIPSIPLYFPHRLFLSSQLGHSVLLRLLRFD